MKSKKFRNLYSEYLGSRLTAKRFARWIGYTLGLILCGGIVGAGFVHIYAEGNAIWHFLAYSLTQLLTYALGVLTGLAVYMALDYYELEEESQPAEAESDIPQNEEGKEIV